ncbi:MAG: hypothetical protein AABM32_06165 [Chloroflexota bacterium]
MAADDIVGALTHHVAELEEQLAAMQADLEAEQSRLATYTESDRLLNDAAADGYRKADAILQRARAEANETLSGAVDERRMLLKEVERLREEREDLRDEIASFGRGGIVEDALPTQVEAPPARDLQTAIAEEMRALLALILADFRSRVASPPAGEVITMEPATAAEVFSAPPEEIRESIVEHVDELFEPAPRSRLVEHIDELPVSEGA